MSIEILRALALELARLDPCSKGLSVDFKEKGSEHHSVWRRALGEVLPGSMGFEVLSIRSRRLDHLVNRRVAFRQWLKQIGQTMAEGYSFHCQRAFLLIYFLELLL